MYESHSRCTFAELKETFQIFSVHPGRKRPASAPLPGHRGGRGGQARGRIPGCQTC